VFTQNPQVNCNGFYLYWIGNAGYGQITATASGGTPQVIDCSVALDIYRTWIPAASAASSNTLTIVGTGQVIIVGAEPLLSITKQVLVGNAGVASSTSSLWNTPEVYNGIGFITTVAPDLSIIMLGINDAFASVSRSAFIANVGALVTAAKVSGDVIIVPPFPNQVPGVLAIESGYCSDLLALAVAEGCVYLDLWQRWGAAYNASYIDSDGTHGINAGYWDLAQVIASVISNP